MATPPTHTPPSPIREEDTEDGSPRTSGLNIR